MEFRNHFNQESLLKFVDDEVNTLPSMTIPDQSLSVREIMDRYAKGYPLEGERTPIYEGEENDLPDLKHMDLAEKEEYMDAAKEEIRQIAAKEKKRKQDIQDQKNLNFKKEKNPKSMFPEDDQGTSDPAYKYPKKTQGPGTESRPAERSGDLDDGASRR